MARTSKTGITVEQLKDEELYGVVLKARREPVALSDDAIARKLWAAEDFYERNLQVFWQATRVFSCPESRAMWPDVSLHVTDFDETRDISEPAYDYSAHYFDENRWGRVDINWRPIRGIPKVVFTWPGATLVFTVPPGWIAPDPRFGSIQIRPNSGQAAIMGFTGWLLGVFAGGRGMPQVILVDYTAGFTPELLAARHQDLLEGVRLHALLGCLGFAANAVVDGGMMNTSLSLDGLSQSRGFGGKYGPYSGPITFALEREAAIRKSWRDQERGIVCVVAAA